MKFGKLQDISKVDFRLPPDPPGQAQRLAKVTASGAPPQLFIGCTGWSMKEWVGHVYPKGTRAKDFLKAYSRQFNTIELNTTHYRIPNAPTVDKWYRESTADFKFCPKVPQTISHSRSLGLGTGLISAFCEAIAGLKEKLGCCFLQLPPYYDASRLAQLEQFLEAFPGSIPLAVEVRHESWFSEPDNRDKLFYTVAESGCSLVITDVAGRRDVLHMGVTNGLAMVRFVGNGLHPTDYERANDWVARLQRWFQSGLQEAYFFPHQPDNVLAPEMGAYLLQQSRAQIPEAATRGPALFSADEPGGEQMSLF